MKARDWIWVGQMDRRNGKTSVMAAATRLLNGTLVCLSSQEANRVSREHDVPTMAVSEPVEHLRGKPFGPLLFDPSAVVQIVTEAVMEIDAAEASLSAAHRKCDRLEDEAENARMQREYAEAELRRLEGARFAERDEETEELVDALARLVANPNDVDAIRAAKDLLPAEKGGYR